MSTVFLEKNKSGKSLAMTDKVTKVSDDTSFFGHPKGLRVLFMTEMWERFGFYGMRAILILYLTKHFIFDQGVAASIYGAFRKSVV